MRVLLALPLLFLLQGFLTVVLPPLPSPDLFLIAALLLLGRLSAPQLVGAAYLIGLVQDVSGYGALGVHALGLAGGVLLASVVAPSAPATPVTRLSALLAALAGKWLVLGAVLVWLSHPAPLAEVARVAPVEALLTLLVGVWFPFGARLPRARAPRTHYL